MFQTFSICNAVMPFDGIHTQAVHKNEIIGIAAECHLQRIHSSEIQLGAAHVGDTNVAAPSGEPYGVSYIIVEGPHTGENPPQHAAHSTQHRTAQEPRPGPQGDYILET